MELMERSFPIEYELLIIYMTEDDEIKHYNKEYKDIEGCLREIRKFKVKDSSEILQYNIKCQRVLI